MGHDIDDLIRRLADQTRLAERLSRARVEQARRELNGIGSAAEAETLARVRLEGDLGKILAQPTMTDARYIADAIAAGAEAATQAARDGADSYDALHQGLAVIADHDDRGGAA